MTNETSPPLLSHKLKTALEAADSRYLVREDAQGLKVMRSDWPAGTLPVRVYLRARRWAQTAGVHEIRVEPPHEIPLGEDPSKSTERSRDNIRSQSYHHGKNGFNLPGVVRRVATVFEQMADLKAAELARHARFEEKQAARQEIADWVGSRLDMEKPSDLLSSWRAPSFRAGVFQNADFDVRVLVTDDEKIEVRVPTLTFQDREEAIAFLREIGACPEPGPPID